MADIKILPDNDSILVILDSVLDNTNILSSISDEVVDSLIVEMGQNIANMSDELEDGDILMDEWYSENWI